MKAKLSIYATFYRLIDADFLMCIRNHSDISLILSVSALKNSLSQRKNGKIEKVKYR